MAVGPPDNTLPAEITDIAPTIGFIIQARMKSERLPGKVLLPMPFGSHQTMIGQIVSQLELSQLPHKTVVATSTSIENEAIADWCSSNSIQYYRGDENDVLSRFIEITTTNKFDVVVRLTADNPLLDIPILDKLIQKHINSGNDYTFSTGLPLGMNVEIVSGAALISLKDKSLNPADIEHVTHFFKNNTGFKVESISFSEDQQFDGVRTTVDYPSDYVVMSTVLSLRKSVLNGIKLIEFIQKEYPFLFMVNSENRQKVQHTTLDSEISAGIELLRKFDLPNAANKLESGVS